MADDRKKYNIMEPVLSTINKKFISLNEDETKRNSKYLEELLNQIVGKMVEKDPLFKSLYRRIFYGGSYYDGLRVGHPEEYDLDLLLALPKLSDPVLTSSNKPGFVHLQLKNFDDFMKQPYAASYPNFRKLFDDKFYLDTKKVLAWMEGVLQKTLNEFPASSAGRVIKTSSGTFNVNFHKGGPALTLTITSNTAMSTKAKMDVDLVTCFVFDGDKWPTNGFRPNPVRSKLEFFIVPKIPKGKANDPIPRYWRLSFQEQERVLIDGKLTLKPTIKLLKKMRDNLQQKVIASYYIKTVLLWIVEKKDASFWRNSLSYVFMTILKEYQAVIASRNIPYYWNKKNNLLGAISGDTLINISNRLTAIIKDVERNLSMNEPKTIAKYLLDSDEYAIFIRGGSDNPMTEPQDSASSCVLS